MRLWQRERDGRNNKNKEGVERVRDGWMERDGWRELARESVIDRQKFSHLILQADFGPNDVGGSRDKTEGQMFLRTWSRQTTLVPAWFGLWKRAREET